MASKADRFYFDNFLAAADCASKATNFLVDCLTHYDSEKLTGMLEHMHALEHAGDTK